MAGHKAVVRVTAMTEQKPERKLAVHGYGLSGLCTRRPMTLSTPRDSAVHPVMMWRCSHLWSCMPLSPYGCPLMI